LGRASSRSSQASTTTPSSTPPAIAPRPRLPELAQRFAKGLPPAERLLLKAPFRTSKGNTEWMWVEVTAWNGEQITRSARQRPLRRPRVKAGATVQVKQPDVFDYYLVKPDGTTEGNETGQILQKRSGK
jgi:uncharacterized protein YegJ (DUF2314 family)